MVVAHNRDYPENLQNALIQNISKHLGSQGLTQKAFQSFFCNTLVQ